MAKALLHGRIPQPILDALRFYDHWQRGNFLPGTSARCVAISDGFSQAYCWGPTQYATWMTNADAAHLFANEWERWAFLDITDTPSQTERAPLTMRDWQRLLGAFAKLGPGNRLRREYRHGEPLPTKTARAYSAAPLLSAAGEHVVR
jgi:hypothetical protein